MSQTKKRKISAPSSSNIQSKKSKHDEENFSGQIPDSTGGDGKRFMHGTSYQQKMTLLTFLTGVTKKQSDKFCFASEMAEAEKFDDFVYIREDPTTAEKYYSFYQAKHYQDGREDLNFDKLCIEETTKKKENFSLLKYFKSFQTIERRFKNYKFENFVICSNIMMSEKSETDLKKHDITLEKIGTDPFFDNEEFVRYKMSINFSVQNEKLITQLKRGMDFYLLAETLVSHIVKGEKLKLSTLIFSLYHIQLVKNKILTLPDSSKKVILTHDFLKGKRKKEVESFFQIFKAEYEKGKMRELKKYANEPLDVSHAFGKNFDANALKKNLVKNPIKCQNFAEELQEIMKRTLNDKNIFTYDRRKYGKNTTKGFINSLAGRVLFYFKNEEIVKFGLKFLNENNNPCDEFYLLKSKLQSTLDADQFDNLKHCKIRISNYYACFEDIEPLHDFVNDEKENGKKIKVFFDNLILLKTPDNEDLDEAIDRCLRLTHKLLDVSYITAYIKKFICDWMEDKEGTFLTNIDAENLIKLTNQKVRVSEFVGITNEYCNVLKNLNFNFKKTDVTIDAITNFLLSPNKRFLFLQTNYGLFGALKVKQVVTKMEEYFGYYDSFLFLRTLSIENDNQQERIMQTFNPTSPVKLLIIVAEDKHDVADSKFLSMLLFSIIDTKKKVILIDCDEEKIMDRLLTKDEKSEVFQEKTKLTNFDDKSIKRLINKPILLQGKKIKLKNLVGSNYDLINTETLVHLVKQKNSSLNLIGIGKKIKYGDFDKGTYFPRKFVRKDVFNIKILNNASKGDDLFIIDLDNSKNLDEIKRSSNGKMILLSEYSALSISPSNNTHFFKQSGDELIWQRSIGSKNSLMNYEKFESQEIDEAELLDKILNEKKMIISDLAGMGKSTTLNHLIMSLKKHKQNMWIIKIRLSAHRKTLETIDDNLFKEITKNEFMSSFDKHLFLSHILNETKMKSVVIIDGYDEVQQEYRHKVDEMLKYLRTRTILLVTTRTKFQNHLEEVLDTFSYSFRPLKERKQFLINLWAKKYNKGFTNKENVFVEKYAKAVLKQFSDPFNEFWNYYDKKSFIGVPQQLIMLGEILYKSDKPKEWDGLTEYLKTAKSKDGPQLPDKFKVYKFYELYVTKKIENFARKEYQDASVSQDEQQQSYQLLALKALLSEEKLTKVLDKDQLKSIPEVMEREKYEGNGIIDYICAERNEINFVHLTYAEFFAAKYLVDYIQDDRVNSLYCINSILENASAVFGFFVDFMLEKSKKRLTNSFKKISLLSFTVKMDYQNCVKKFMPERYNFPVNDSKNRTPLHYAAERGNIKCVVHLLCYVYGMLLNECTSEESIDYLWKYIEEKGGKNNKTAIEYAGAYKNVVEFLLAIKSLKSGSNEPEEDLSKSLLNCKIVSYDRELLIQGYTRLLYDFFKNNLKMFELLIKLIDDKNLLSQIIDEDFVEKLADDKELANNERIEKICYLIDNDIIYFPCPSSYTEAEKVKEYGINKDNDTIVSLIESNDYIHDFERACEEQSSLLIRRCVEKYKTKLYGPHGSPIHILLQNGLCDSNMFKLCVDNGIDMNYRDEYGNTALHVATMSPHYKCYDEDDILQILAYGADANLQNKNGDTPLFNMINKDLNEMDVIKLLVDNEYCSANLDLRNNDNKTVMDIAVEQKKEDIVKYLSSKSK